MSRDWKRLLRRSEDWKNPTDTELAAAMKDYAFWSSFMDNNESRERTAADICLQYPEVNMAKHFNHFFTSKEVCCGR